jgi:hypothetical protein
VSASCWRQCTCKCRIDAIACGGPDPVRSATPGEIRALWRNAATFVRAFQTSYAPLTADDAYAPAVSMRFTPTVMATTLMQPCSIQRTGSRAVLVHGVTEML